MLFISLSKSLVQFNGTVVKLHLLIVLYWSHTPAGGTGFLPLKAGILYPPAERLLPVLGGQWAELSHWPGHCPKYLKNDNIFVIIIAIFLFWKIRPNNPIKKWMKTWIIMQLSSMNMIVINIISDYFSFSYSYNIFSLMIMLIIYALDPSQRSK